MTQNLHRIYVARVLFLLALSLIPQAHAREGEVGNQPQAFHEFWGHFKSGVLAGNKEQVAAVTCFPFKTRGMLDSNPVRLHDRRSFDDLFDRLLAQDSGLKKEPEPMRDLIQRTDFSQVKPVKKHNSRERIGNFVFQRLDNRWRFVMAYLDEE